VALFVSLAGALFPALQAARADPVDSLGSND
jgi:ABC-type antimicrobial peptide transport system permease subunit